jgi:hypothetical protein
MENFLDLLFALEGLFSKSTSSEFIKIACSTLLEKKKNKAMKNLETLNIAFKLRNDLVHGGIGLTGMEEIKIGGKTTLSQDIFWDLKSIVAGAIMWTIEKLHKNNDMKNLRISPNDLINKIYDKT